MGLTKSTAAKKAEPLFETPRKIEYEVVGRFGEWHIRRGRYTLAIAEREADALLIVEALNLLKDK